MLGLGKTKPTVDIHPRDAFSKALDAAIAAAKARHLPLRTIGELLASRAEGLARESAINWSAKTMMLDGYGRPMP